MVHREKPRLLSEQLVPAVITGGRVSPGLTRTSIHSGLPLWISSWDWDTSVEPFPCCHSICQSSVMESPWAGGNWMPSFDRPLLSRTDQTLPWPLQPGLTSIPGVLACWKSLCCPAKADWLPQQPVNIGPQPIMALSLRPRKQYRALGGNPPLLPCPQLHGGGWLSPALIASLLALGDTLEDIQLFTIPLLHTLACDLGWVRPLCLSWEMRALKVGCTAVAARREGLAL